MRNDIMSILVAGLAVIIAVFVAFDMGRKMNKPDSSIKETVILRDTVTIIQPAEPIILERVKPRIVYLRDTIIETRPFIATIDTVIQFDTIYATYQFPNNIFDLRISPKPDTSRFYTVYITKEVKRERAWWEAPAYVVGGVVIGFFLGNANK